MSRDQGELHSTDGGQQIDTSTDLDAVYTWLDRFIVCVGLSFLALCAMCVLMVVYYFFG